MLDPVVRWPLITMGLEVDVVGVLLDAPVASAERVAAARARGLEPRQDLPTEER